MTKSTSNKPTHTVRYAVDRKDYREIGVAWMDDEGNLSVKMNGTPLPGWDGTLFIRTRKGADENAEAA